MFERLTKKFTSKATNHILDGATQSVNERVNQYIDALMPWLIFGGIVIGTRHFTKRHNQLPSQTYVPGAYIPGGQPVIVNNYYHEREEHPYERKQRNYIQNGHVCACQRQGQKTNPKR